MCMKKHIRLDLIYNLVMNYLSDALKPLKQDESVIKKSLIGTLALFASIFIIPYFLYQGYLLKILDETKESVPSELPQWDNLGNMFVLGLGGFLLSLLLSLPSTIILYTPVLLEASDGAILAAQGIGSLLSLILSYLSLAILALYARDGLSGVTDVSRLTNILFSLEYLIGVLIITGLGIAFGIGMFILILVTLGLGIFLIPFILPIYNYFIMYIAGNAITEAEAS